MKKEDTYILTITSGPLKGESFEIAPGVTYLVGKNGAGKSQLLEAVKLGKCNIMLKNDNPRPRPLNYAARIWGEITYNDDTGRKNDFRDIRPLLKELDQIEVEDIEEAGKRTEIRDESGHRVVTQSTVIIPKLHGEAFKKEMLSSGTQALYGRFAWKANSSKIYPENRNFGPSGPMGHIMLWDEPEQFLHPSQQKMIPKRLDEWIKKTQPTLNRGGSHPPIFILTATHSPFILSGIENRRNHHVITLEKCKVQSGSIQKSLAEVRMDAHHLFGTGLQDLMPGKLILTEASVAVLLRNIASSLELEIEDFIVTVNGDSNMENRVDNLLKVMKLMTNLGRSWPERIMFKLEVHTIADDIELKKKFDSLKSSEWLLLHNHALGTKQLEDIYPLDWVNEFFKEEGHEETWDGEELINTFLGNTLDIKRNNKGLFKAKLAEYVAGKIKTEEDLKKYLPEVNKFFLNWKSSEEG